MMRLSASPASGATAATRRPREGRGNGPSGEWVGKRGEGASAEILVGTGWPRADSRTRRQNNNNIYTYYTNNNGGSRSNSNNNDDNNSNGNKIGRRYLCARCARCAWCAWCACVCVCLLPTSTPSAAWRVPVVGGLVGGNRGDVVVVVAVAGGAPADVPLYKEPDRRHGVVFSFASECTCDARSRPPVDVNTLVIVSGSSPHA